MESWTDYLATLNEKDTKINEKGKKNCDYIYDIFRGIKEKDYLMCPKCHVNKLHCECVKSVYCEPDGGKANKC
jgi:hypothetical protein